MGIKKFNPITPVLRTLTVSDFSEVTASRPERSLIQKKTRSGGRNHFGRETNINIGGGHKKRYRVIDFRRDKVGVPGVVATIEYDPNRTCRIALVKYADGAKRYIIAPQGLTVGQKVQSAGANKSGEVTSVDITVGNTMPLRDIPTGEMIHNIELKPGKGGQLVRSAGTGAQLVAKEGAYCLLRMPSGEMRKVLSVCKATLGTVGNSEHQNIQLGKAGRSRWLGRRPHNRGVTKNPVDHPMGGGEGRSSGGRHPCSPTGVPAKGYKTRHNKRTDKFIVRGRPKKRKKR